MNLKLQIPHEILLDQVVTKVTAEASNGHFCLLPNHVDFAADLVPGILSFNDENDQEHFWAVDEGILVKCGQDVFVSTRNAATDGDLGQLATIVEERFRVLDEQEEIARSAAARLEAGLVRRFLDFEKVKR